MTGEDELNDPEAVYQKTLLQIFPSHEEASEATAKEKANMSPQQHLANVTQRIKAMYADELKTPMDKTLRLGMTTTAVCTFKIVLIEYLLAIILLEITDIIFFA